jgi:hypothetical protein
MSESSDDKVQPDAIIAQYRAELERLNYVRGSINVYLTTRATPCSSINRKSLRIESDQGAAGL